MEDDPNYLAYLRVRLNVLSFCQLSQCLSQPLEVVDPRVKILPMGGYDWGSYHLIDEMQLLSDVPNVPWTEGGLCRCPANPRSLINVDI